MTDTRGYDTLTNKKNKMTFNKEEEIRKTKEDISILQEKLQKLQAQDDIELFRSGEVKIVDVNHKTYYRIFYTDSFYGVVRWFQRVNGVLYPVNDYQSLEDGYKKKYETIYIPSELWEYSYNEEEWKETLDHMKEKYDPTPKEPEWKPKPQTKEVVKQKDDYPYKKYTPEETERGLKEAFREAVKQGVVSSVDTPKESWMNKPIEELVDILEKNPPDCLRFELGKTLEQIIEQWWCDVVYGPHENWTMEECISDLCDKISLWLPKEQNSEGTQRIETIVAVDTHNELLRKIKSKLRNKKTT